MKPRLDDVALWLIIMATALLVGWWVISDPGEYHRNEGDGYYGEQR